MSQNKNLQKSDKKTVKNEKFGQEYVEPGDNAKYIRHAMVALDLPPIDLDIDEQVKERIDFYFTHCMDNDIKPTVTGLARFLGVSRFTLHQWFVGKRRSNIGNRTEIIQKAYDLLAELWEDYMLNGKINPVSGIFIGKNHFNYTNKQEVVVTPNNPLGEPEDMKAIEEKYIESVADEVD